MKRSLFAALVVAALLPAGAQASERIVWSRFAADFGSLHIVSANPDGSRVRQLTHAGPGIYDYDPELSPDGSQIVFERDLADGTATLVVMDADGSDQRVVDTGCADPCAADAAPTWLPGGGRIAYTRVVGPFDAPNESARSAVLWTVRPDGSGRRRLSEPGIDGTYEDYGAHFGHGYVQFLRVNDATGHSALYRMRPDGTHPQRLTRWSLDADLNDLDHDEVVFETYGHGGQAQNVAVMPVFCGGPATCEAQIRYVTHNPADGRVNSVNPGWSPDGTRIVMSEWTDPSSDDADDLVLAGLFTLAPDGSGKLPITGTDRWNMRPDWGPA